jgi:hypothetical protein
MGTPVSALPTPAPFVYRAASDCRPRSASYENGPRHAESGPKLVARLAHQQWRLPRRQGGKRSKSARAAQYRDSPSRTNSAGQAVPAGGLVSLAIPYRAFELRQHAIEKGQGLFKDQVSKIETRCRLTGVENPVHLIASYCKPWRDSNNEERLDGENGLLLRPSIDHLFDRGFIGFEDDGKLNCLTCLSPAIPAAHRNRHRKGWERWGLHKRSKIFSGFPRERGPAAVCAKLT